MKWPREDDAAVLPLAGLEADNLLAFLALLGLLRALDEAKPRWHARASWKGPPWVAQLHLAENVGQDAVAEAAERGLEKIASGFEFEGRKNVDFDRKDYRQYATSRRNDPIAAALAAELPERDTKVRPAPLVMMFGQGHQDFLTRLSEVPKLKKPVDIAKALFQHWKRDDETPAFRWDPTEDQRYALRFGSPSKAGAATTTHGANRLATAGFLSFKCVPGSSKQRAVAVIRNGVALAFTWPIWTEPLSLHAIDRLLSAEDRLPGVEEVYRAQRVHNGKFMNVTRGVPWRKP